MGTRTATYVLAFQCKPLLFACVSPLGVIDFYVCELLGLDDLVFRSVSVPCFLFTFVFVSLPRACACVCHYACVCI